MAHRRKSAKVIRRKGRPARVTVHRREIELTSRGFKGERQQIRKAAELPMAEELTARDLPRLEAAARRQMERNRRRLGG